MGQRPTAHQLWIILFVTLGSVTYGYSSSIIATTLAQPSFISYMHLDTASNAVQLIGAINGLFQAGGFLGTLSCWKSAEFLGRRKALFLGSVIVLIGGALQAGSVNIEMYLVMRFITGLGVGSLVVLVPLYQSEIAPAEIRGFVVSTHAVMLSSGYVVASWVGLGFYFVNAKGAQWRIPIAIQCLPPLILAAGVMFLPESPRWLISHDRLDEAFKSFKATAARALDADDETGQQAEFSLLVAQITHERQTKQSFMELMRRPSMRMRFFLGFVTMFGFQSTGTNVINNYGPSLYKSLGFGTVQQLLIQSGWISTCPVANLFTTLYLDKMGRRKMFIYGYVLIIVALIGECITVSSFTKTGDHRAAAAAVFFLFFFVVIASGTIDGTTYVYATEIFPTPQRASGAAVSFSGQYASTIIYLEVAPLAFKTIGWKFYLLFIALCTVMIFIVYFVYPETNKKSLEELAAVFGDSVEGLTKEEEDERYRVDGHHKGHHPDAQAIDEKTTTIHLDDVNHSGATSTVE